MIELTEMEVIEIADNTEASFPERLVSMSAGSVLRFSLKHYSYITNLISNRLKFQHPDMVFKTSKKDADGNKDGLTFYVKRTA
jgi:hypothetical protein